MIKIAVVGAGGIGGICAAHMKKAGYAVYLVDVNPELINKVNNKGLEVFGVVHRFVEPFVVHASLAAVNEMFDIVFIATKATVLQKVIDAVKPHLKSDGVVVSLQNGVCEYELEKNFAASQVMGCVVGWGATVHYPGVLEMTSKGSFMVGPVANNVVNHYQEVVDLLETVVPVIQTNNILGHLYAKLIVNSCITTLGAICGLYLGKMLSVKKIRNLFIGIVREGVEVCDAIGIKLVSYDGKLDLRKFTSSGWLANFKTHLLIRIIGIKYRRLKSSSLQSLQSGDKTEIDFLNGHLVQRAKEKQVNTPLNAYLVQIVKEIERGERAISEDNFNDSFFNTYE